MKITIYKTTVCPFSAYLLDDLNRKSVAVEVKVIDKNQDDALEMIRLTGSSFTPVVKIAKDDGSEVVVEGYNIDKKKKISQMLGVDLGS